MANTLFTALTVNEEANLSGGATRIRDSIINGTGGNSTGGRQNNRSGRGDANTNGSADVNTGGAGVVIGA